MMTATPAPVTAGDSFATTRWSVVLAASQHHKPHSVGALEELCRNYWFPLYAYVRRRGHSPEDAEDSVQGFFARFLEKNYLRSLNAERGRFRAFLLAALKHYLANEWDRTQRLKRGGGATHFSLDWQTADNRFQVAAAAASPDQEYDRQWALTLLAQVIARLQAEWEAEGKAQQFAQLRIFLEAGRGEPAAVEIAESLGLDAGTVRVTVHRLRKRYRALLREEICSTLADPTLVDQELRALFGAFEC